jgi:hypothetical protein
MSTSSRTQSLLRLAPGLALAAITAVAGAWALQHREPAPSIIDGRAKAQLERPTRASLESTDWMASVDTFMDERLPGRGSLLAAHAGFATVALRDPVLHDVYVAGPNGQLLEKPPALTVRATLGEEAAKLAESVGPAKVLWVYAPRKEEIYADALPASWANPYATIRKQLLSDYAAAGSVLDLTHLMTERRAGGDDYFRTDHHWTPDSAKAAADAIAEQLIQTGAPIGSDARTYVETTGSLPFYGSTGRIVTLGATAADTVTVPVPEGGFAATMCVDEACGLPTFSKDWLDKGSLYGNRYRAFLGGNHGLAVITNDSPSASGRVLLLTDSFGNAVATYLAERVAQLIVVDERHYDGVPLNQLASQFEPDSVVVLHNPQTLLTPSFKPAVWTTTADLSTVTPQGDTYETAVYDKVAVVADDGLMLLNNHEQKIDSGLGADAKALADAIAATGVPQVWLYAPRKEEVYADLFPKQWENLVDEKRERVLGLLAKGHEVVDLTPLLSDPASRDAYFYRTDHHWTPEGAQVAVEQIVAELAKQGVDIPHDSRVWRRVDGPLAFAGSEALDLPDTAPRVSEPMWYLEPEGGFRARMCTDDGCDEPGLKEEWLSNPDPLANRYYAFLGGGFRTQHLHNDSPNAHGTIVMLKDSFSHPVALMLAERVTDLYLVDERGYDGPALADYVREVDADAVVVLHNQVTLLSQAFNRELWRDAAG